MENHIYKNEARRNIDTNAHTVYPSPSRPASRAIRLARRLIFSPFRAAHPITHIVSVAEDLASWRSSISMRRLAKLIHLCGYEKEYRKGNDFLFFIFRPTPSCRFSLISNPHIVPRPRAEGGASGDDDGVAGVMMISGGHAFPFRSFAPARSLFRIHCVGR